MANLTDKMVDRLWWNGAWGTLTRQEFEAELRGAWSQIADSDLAALIASPAGDDPKALDAAARSSSTEAVEQEVERLRHLAQSRYEFMREMASELEAYGAKGWIAKVEAMARPSPVPAACKPEGENHG